MRFQSLSSSSVPTRIPNIASELSLRRLGAGAAASRAGQGSEKGHKQAFLQAFLQDSLQG